SGEVPARPLVAHDQLLADPAGTAREVWVNGPYDYYKIPIEGSTFQADIVPRSSFPVSCRSGRPRTGSARRAPR
ncbi:hypothetical protein NGM37_26510, partial [Streptomyces sp. TRM76130]|nr:hypothetical protein [Streptomyces sp. TRM76130]